MSEAVLLRCAILCAMGAAWPLAGWAQSQAPAATVVVTGTRVSRAPFDLPASVQVIEASEIRQHRPQVNLTESLGGVAGVTARDRQNFAQDVQLSVRGFGARSSFGIRGVRVYVDGIPATLPDGQGQVSHVDLGSARRIEVLRGPFSALYGNSSGGVVQVFTEDGAGPPTLETGAVAGEGGLWRTQLKLRGAQGRLGYVANVSHFETQGTREHAAARRDGANIKLGWQSDTGARYAVVANGLRAAAQDPLGLTRAQLEADPRSADAAAQRFDTRKQVAQSQLGLSGEHRLAAGQSLQWMLYGGSRRTEQFQALPTGPQASPLHPGGVIRLVRDYRGADLRWLWRPAGVAGSSLVVGLAHDALYERRQGFENFSGSLLGVEGALRRDEDNRASNVDPYLQASLALGARWRLEAGVRHSRVRIRSSDRYIVAPNGDDSGAADFRATTPVLGLMFAAGDTLHLYASAGRGFETPTLNELAYRSDGSAGLNLGLRPARSDNLELGAKWKPLPGQSLDLALFETRTRDELVTRSNSGGRATFQNAASTRRRGAELSWAAAIGSDWRAQAALSLLDARYRQGFGVCSATPCTTPDLAVPAGRRLPGVARGSAFIAADWAPAQGWRAGVQARYASALPVNDRGTDAAGAFAVAAVHAGYLARLGGLRLHGFARVDNLFGRRYAGSVIVNESNGRYFEPAPGRRAMVGLEASAAF